MRRNLAIIFSLVVVLTATTYFGLYINSAPSYGGEGHSLAEVEDAETYINEKGEKWGPLPEGRREIKISSAEVYPKFVKVIIDPLKVIVGDTQKMSVVLRDTADIEEVIATIKTDNDTVIIPLKRVSEKAVTEEDILNQEYFVREGKLYIASDENRHLALTDEIKSRLFSNVQVAGPFTASAQEGYLKEFTYEGEWIVRDTHVKTYHTVFTVRNALGEENSITMAWSDPCPGLLDFGGGDQTVTGSCAFSTVEGVDNGHVTLASGVNVSILPGGFFVWNSGKTITMAADDSSSFSLDGGEIKQANLYLVDIDGDNYALNSNKTVLNTTLRVRDTLGLDCFDGNANVYQDLTGFRDADLDTYTTGGAQSICSGASLLSGWRPSVNGADCNDNPATGPFVWWNGYGTDDDRDGYGINTFGCHNGSFPADSTIGQDCYDRNDLARPGQASYFPTVRGTFNDIAGNTGNSYDYNCDGIQTISSNLTGVCQSCIFGCQEIPADGGQGYTGTVPTCGNSANWVTDSGGCDASCFERTCVQNSRIQLCR